MNAAVMYEERPTIDDLRAWLADLCRRYERVQAGAAPGDERMEAARVGAKLAGLLALADAEMLTVRDAALLPLLACWVAGRIEALASRQVRYPEPLPFRPFRSATLAMEHAFYGRPV